MEIKDSDKPVTCLFCNQSEDNELLYGKFYRLDGDIITHYYCLLLSSNMEQNGGDNDGILGFLRADILKELKRGKRLTCSYCKSTGATLGCCMSKCKKVFHLPCGRKAGSLHQFFGQFKSFCASHRPVQKIDPAILAQLRISDIACPICYDTVDPTASKSTLWAPCCRVTALFHRDCVQKLAMSAGYFFRCPLCNNKPHFLSAMQDNGIYIPERDASWEMVPNAYQELLHRHHRCDAQRCQCPKGRNHELTGTRWELVLCKYCGSQGVHIGCGRLKWSNPDWECNDCKAMLQQSYERDEPENEGKEIQAFALVPDASEEEQSPSHPSSFRPIRRTGNNRRVGPRKPENIEKQPPAEEDSSSSHSTSTASHPVSPTLIVVSDDDEIIVIPDDDDDEDDDDDDDDYNTSNRPQKKDPNVVLTGDGIAIPVVKVPNSEYEENFCIIGDLNVQVPKESEEIPSVVIQPHSSRSQDTNINLPVSQVSSTNNLRTKNNNMPIHTRLTSTARNNMRPQAPISTDPTPAALVRYMPLTNSPSEGEQVPKRIRLSDPSPINYPENSSLGGNMLKTSFREPTMLSQTVNVNQSAMMMQQRQLAPAPQPTIMRGQSISRPAIMMMMPEQQQLGQHSMAIRAQSSNQSTMVVMQQQQPMQQQAEIPMDSPTSPASTVYGRYGELYSSTSISDALYETQLYACTPTSRTAAVNNSTASTNSTRQLDRSDTSREHSEEAHFRRYRHNRLDKTFLNSISFSVGGGTLKMVVKSSFIIRFPLATRAEPVQRNTSDPVRNRVPVQKNTSDPVRNTVPQTPQMENDAEQRNGTTRERSKERCKKKSRVPWEYRSRKKRKRSVNSNSSVPRKSGSSTIEKSSLIRSDNVHPVAGYANTPRNQIVNRATIHRLGSHANVQSSEYSKHNGSTQSNESHSKSLSPSKQNCSDSFPLENRSCSNTRILRSSLECVSPTPKRSRKKRKQKTRVLHKRSVSPDSDKESESSASGNKKRCKSCPPSESVSGESSVETSRRCRSSSPSMDDLISRRNKQGNKNKRAGSESTGKRKVQKTSSGFSTVHLSDLYSGYNIMTRGKSEKTHLQLRCLNGRKRSFASRTQSPSTEDLTHTRTMRKETISESRDSVVYSGKTGLSHIPQGNTSFINDDISPPHMETMRKKTVSECRNSKDETKYRDSMVSEGKTESRDSVVSSGETGISHIPQDNTSINNDVSPPCVETMRKKTFSECRNCKVETKFRDSMASSGKTGLPHIPQENTSINNDDVSPCMETLRKETVSECRDDVASKVKSETRYSIVSVIPEVPQEIVPSVNYNASADESSMHSQNEMLDTDRELLSRPKSVSAGKDSATIRRKSPSTRSNSHKMQSSEKRIFYRSVVLTRSQTKPVLRSKRNKKHSPFFEYPNLAPRSRKQMNIKQRVRTSMSPYPSPVSRSQKCLQENKSGKRYPARRVRSESESKVTQKKRQQTRNRSKSWSEGENVSCSDSSFVPNSKEGKEEQCQNAKTSVEETKEFNISAKDQSNCDTTSDSNSAPVLCSIVSSSSPVPICSSKMSKICSPPSTIHVESSSTVNHASSSSTGSSYGVDTNIFFRNVEETSEDRVARLKAKVLAARKFRPASQTEDMQRRMMKELQSLYNQS